MIRRTVLILGAVMVAAGLGAGAAAPARAASRDAEMREAVVALRGLIDREGAARFFEYPRRAAVRPGRLASGWWPRDPWTGRLLRPGTTRGHYSYRVRRDRRRYRLVGFLGGGRTFVLSGGMPKTMMLAYDHRSEEGINLIRQYIEDYAAAHGGVYPLPSEVRADGPVGDEPGRRYWPSNPWDHYAMEQRTDHGSFSYRLAPDRRSYTLRLHRALKRAYVLRGTTVVSPWQQPLASLEDEILRRSGHVLSGYVRQWALQHAGTLPAVIAMSPSGSVGTVHRDWPDDPASGAPMRPGTVPGAYTYAPASTGAYSLTIHLNSGHFRAGGIAPSPPGPARSSGPPES